MRIIPLSPMASSQTGASLKFNIAELILCKYEVLQYQAVNQQVSEGRKSPINPVHLTFFFDK